MYFHAAFPVPAGERLFLCPDDPVVRCPANFDQTFAGILFDDRLISFAVMPTGTFVRLAWTIFARITHG
jgi:hypothetical protein